MDFYIIIMCLPDEYVDMQSNLAHSGCVIDNLTNHFFGIRNNHGPYQIFCIGSTYHFNFYISILGNKLLN